MKKNFFILSLFWLWSIIVVIAQIPVGYYDAATAKSNAQLKTALHQIIEVGTRLSYGSGSGATWSGFEKTDLHPDGHVWDMYSLNKVTFPGGGGVPSGMNIEHSVAKSWWGGSSNNAYKDLYHLNPSNSQANSARGSYPLGTNTGGTFDNGSIKVGKNTFGTEYTGVCFEPLDEYKGDFARAYLYMFTCYEDFSWTGTSAPTMLLATETWPMLKPWAKELLVKWHRQDPVSEKELKRSSEIYKIQNNRNPYIDYPELVEYLWGTKVGQPWTPQGEDYPYIVTPSYGQTIDFGTVAYTQSVTQKLQVKAAHITGDLSLAVSGTHAANFNLSVANIEKTNAEAGQEVTITYTAQSVGQQNAVLSISGGGVTAITVNLKALASDEFMALPASNINATDFTANWTVSAMATGYTLDVFSLISNGVTQPKIAISEDFTSGVPANWTNSGYIGTTDLNGSLRLASSGSPGVVSTPVIDLSTQGNSLTVIAKQYSNDTGAKLTATLNGNELAVWTTTADFKTYTVAIPAATNTSTISLSALAGSRVYVDKVIVETQGAVQTPVSVSGYPRAVGDVLSYTVNGLQPDSAYFYTVTPLDNDADVSNRIGLRTNFESGVETPQENEFLYLMLPDGVLLKQLHPESRIVLTDITGKRLQLIQAKGAEVFIKLNKRGIYLLQVQQQNKLNTLKVLY
jgi:endonuclease I